VGNSQWYENLGLVLQAAANIAWKIYAQKRACLIHCSDGWDRTAQNTTLVMLSLDPFYRSIKGFCLLIQKEWLSFGHRFRTRLATSEKVSGEYSPVFIQWLDAVWQMTCFYPDGFEFNETLLLDLVDLVICNRYGTFLGDNEREYGSRFFRYTTSVWTDVLAEAGKPNSRYKNPRYKGNVGLSRDATPREGLSKGEKRTVGFLPIVFSQARFKVWNKFWFKWHPHLWALE